jgi:hypothetical protein
MSIPPEKREVLNPTGRRDFLAVDGRKEDETSDIRCRIRLTKICSSPPSRLVLT